MYAYIGNSLVTWRLFWIDVVNVKRDELTIVLSGAWCCENDIYVFIWVSLLKCDICWIQIKVKLQHFCSWH